MGNRWQINRRTFLRGAGRGRSIAPSLDAMLHNLARSACGAAVQTTPTRMAFLYVPNGVTIQQWTPAQLGTTFSAHP